MGLVFVLGGIGLFLLGMNMMTEGLKDVAGDALNKWLNRFTGGTFSSILSGIFITGLLQSSTATTIITIGFVSAGLLTFTQSIGVILGANIGSTSTGWLVSLLGFKVNLQELSFPIIGIGILLRLFVPARFKPYGTFLAGFGLLFLGIQTLQEGFTDSGRLFQFEHLSGAGFLQQLLLIGIGIAMTIVMQSSGAAVATTLTILHAKGITFEQAAFLVIGQNIGTTATAIFASISASVSAKRTAWTHVLFNVVTAVIIVLLSPILLPFILSMSTWMRGSVDEAFGIALFHTLFSVIGVLIFLPFIHHFAHMVIRMIPEKGNPLTRYLDANVAAVPQVAIDAASKTLLGIIKEVTEEIILFIKSETKTEEFEKKLLKVEDAVKTTRSFLSSFLTHSVGDQDKHLSMVHALDHIERLIKVLRDEQKIAALRYQERRMAEWLVILQQVYDSVSAKEMEAAASLLEETSMKIADERRARRQHYFLQTVKSETELEIALAKAQALLWIDRLVYHYWRAVQRLTECMEHEDDSA